jgi:excisionase family DNA binding protein
MKAKDTTTNPRPESEPWVNTKTACLHLGVSMPTLRRWIKAGRIKPKRTPTGEHRFKRSELDLLLD